ncbi:SDR family oxidoreductase [Paenibacillus sepulcri]|uniref:SDR family oxidoreductase n=1 Tax=Paenibacillus sepulcri TaxID=359917 RepID=A0ABS7CE13_9BACL|nr:SDR family oxidoreductase [Paenibacillus sepulcri]
MTRTIFITQGSHRINRLILECLLEREYQVCLQFTKRQEADECLADISADCRKQLYIFYGHANEASIMIDQAVSRMGSLDYLIHGVDTLNEEELFEADPLALGTYTADLFRDIFLFSRSIASHMAKNKQGHIVFPLMADALYYDGYPSSPIINLGKLALMKSLAKEFSPFRIAVNAVTLGYYAPEESLNSKELKQRLEIHALKPLLPGLKELVSASIDMLFQTKSHLVSGQNLHVGHGTDTFI